MSQFGICRMIPVNLEQGWQFSELSFAESCCEQPIFVRTEDGYVNWQNGHDAKTFYNSYSAKPVHGFPLD
jgi:hypothetical protein